MDLISKVSKPDAGTLLVEDVLQLDGEDLAELVELLRAHLRHGVARLQREFLEWLLVRGGVGELHHRRVARVCHAHENLFPEPVHHARKTVLKRNDEAKET